MANKTVEWIIRANYKQARKEADQTARSLENLDDRRRRLNENSIRDDAAAEAAERKRTKSAKAMAAALSTKAQAQQRDRTATDASTRSTKAAAKAESDRATATKQTADAATRSTQATARQEAATRRLSAANREQAASAAKLTDLENRRTRAVLAQEDAERRLAMIEAKHGRDSNQYALALNRMKRATISVADADRRLSAEHDRVSRSSVNVERNNHRLLRAMTGLGSSTHRTHGLMRKFMGVLKVSLYVAAAEGISKLAGAIGSLAGGITALLSPLGRLTASFAALPGLVGAGLGMLGTVLASFSGVGDAIKQGLTAQKEAGKTAKDTAKSARSLADAQRNVGKAHKDAARQIRDAEQAVKDARRNAAENRRQNAQTIKQAELGVKQAQDAVRQSQKDLTQARKDARAEIDAMRRSLKDLELQERGAALSVEEAKKRLGEVMLDPNATTLEKQQAQLALDEALNTLDNVKRESKKATKDYQDASKKGVSGSDQVIAAHKAEADAIQGLKDAQNGLKEARHQAALSARQDARAIRDAQQGVKDAQESARESIRSAKDAVVDAKDAMKEGTGAASKYADAMKDLSPAAQRFVKIIVGLRDEGKKLRDAAAAGLLPGLGNALQRMTKLTPLVSNGLFRIGRALGNAAEQGSKMLTSGPFQAKFARIMDTNVTLTQLAGRATNNFMAALIQLTDAARPFTEWIGRVIVRWSEWARGLLDTRRETSRFNRYLMGPVRRALRTWGESIANIAKALFGLGKAGAKQGQSLSKAFQRMTKRWADWTNGMKGQNYLKKWFDRSRPALREAGRLVHALVKAFADLSMTDTSAAVFRDLREILLPALVKLMKELQKTDILHEAIVAIADLGEALANMIKIGGGGILEGFIKSLGYLTSAMKWISEHERAAKVLGTFAAALGAIQAMKFVTTITGLRSIWNWRQKLLAQGAINIPVNITGNGASLITGGKGGGLGAGTTVTGTGLTTATRNFEQLGRKVSHAAGAFGSLGLALAFLPGPLGKVGQAVSILGGFLWGFEPVLAAAGRGIQRLAAKYAPALASKLGALSPKLTKVSGGLAAIGNKAADAGGGLTVVGTSAKKAGKGFGALGKSLVLVGEVLLILEAFKGIDWVFQKIFHRDNTASVSSMAKALKTLGETGKSSGPVMRTFGGDLDKFGRSMEVVSSGFGKWTHGFTDLFGKSGWEQAKENLGDVDAGLAQLVKSGNAQQAEAAFKQLAASAKKHGVSLSDLRKEMPKYVAAQKRAAEADANKRLTESFDSQRRAVERLRRAQERANEGRKATADSFLSVEQAVDNSRGSLRRFTRMLEQQAKDLLEFGANAQKAAARGVPQSLIDQLKKMGPAGAAIMRKLANATDKQVDRMVAAWGRWHKARREATRPIPIKIYPDTGGSFRIRDRKTGALGPVGQAAGGTVDGPRYPYGDKVFTALAPGEEVISNRYGQADRFRRDRRAGRIPSYADGGTVQGLAGGGTAGGGGVWDAALSRLGRQIVNGLSAAISGGGARVRRATAGLLGQVAKAARNTSIKQMLVVGRRMGAALHDGIANGIKKIRPVVERIKRLIDTLKDHVRKWGPKFATAFKDPLKKVADHGAWLWDKLRKGFASNLDTIKGLVRKWGPQALSQFKKPLNDMRSTAKTVWDRIGGIFSDGFTKLKSQARSFKSDFGTIWHGIIEKVKAPIRAVVKALNNGLIKPINKVAKALGAGGKDDKIVGEISLPSGFRRGGIPSSKDTSVYPGWSPGRDIGYVGVSGGEAIMRPEWTRAVGKRQIDKWNRDARLGRLGKKGRGRGYFLGGVLPTQAAEISRHSGYEWAKWAGDLNDPGNETGDPVFAWKKGTVAKVVYLGDRSYGRYVQINHPGGQNTLYAHLSKATVEQHDEVRAGQKIGEVGSIGRTSGAHLHFEIRGGHVDFGDASGEGGGNWWDGLTKKVAKAARNLGDWMSGLAPKLKAENLMGKFGDNPYVRMLTKVPEKIKGWALEKLKGIVSDYKDTHAVSSEAGTAGPAVGTAKNVATVKAEAAKYGWNTGHQWRDLYTLLSHESGFRNTIPNQQGSSAYGIFQFLDSTWATVGGHKTSDPHLQAVYGMKYIKNKYGTPSAAWAHWLYMQRLTGSGSYAKGGIIGALSQALARFGGSVKAFATGGKVPGIGNRDTVPAMLTPGEFVVSKGLTKQLGISSNSDLQYFAEGGFVERRRQRRRRQEQTTLQRRNAARRRLADAEDRRKKRNKKKDDKKKADRKKKDDKKKDEKKANVASTGGGSKGATVRMGTFNAHTGSISNAKSKEDFKKILPKVDALAIQEWYKKFAGLDDFLSNQGFGSHKGPTGTGIAWRKSRFTASDFGSYAMNVEHVGTKGLTKRYLVYGLMKDKKTKETFWLASAHFVPNAHRAGVSKNLRDKIMAEQVRRVTAKIKDLKKTAPVILGADFNRTDTDIIKGLTSAYKKHGADRAGIDQIYSTLEHATVSQIDNLASDHPAVFTSYKLDGTKTGGGVADPTPVEDALINQIAANKKLREFHSYLLTLSNWGLKTLVNHLIEMGVEEGYNIAQSASTNRPKATELDAAYKDGDLLSSDDQTHFIKMVSLLSTAPVAPGLRDLARQMELSDLAVVKLVEAAQKLGSLSNIPAERLARLLTDIASYRAGTFYMAGGGLVPGNGNRDSVPAMLTPGEFVIRKRVASALGLGTLVPLNAMQHFAAGGPVLAPRLAGLPKIAGSSINAARLSNQIIVNGGIGVQYVYDVDIHNPVAERSTKSMTKLMQRQAAMGKARGEE